MYWDDTSISKIVSALGKSIMTDECMTKNLRVFYAKVLVEIDITQELKKSVVIKDHNGKKIQQKVEYE